MESNFSILCRGCLCQKPEMHNLFAYVSENLTLAQILSETTSTKITENNGMPLYLCLKCADIVVDFYNFKSLFLTNQKSFFERPQKGISNYFNCTKPSNINPSNENINTEDSVDKCFDIGNDTNELLENELESKSKNDSNYINIESKQNEAQSDNNQCELLDNSESIVFYCEICEVVIEPEEKFLDHVNCKHNLELSVHKIENLDTIDSKSTNINDLIQCKACKIFVPKTEYEYHRDTHKTHVCFCGAKYVTATLLEAHRKSKHSEERNYSCNFCSRAFKVKGLLSKHLRLHTHPREEVCDICGQRFNDRSVLKTHIYLRHNPRREFQCYLCGLRFPLKSTLEKHIRRHDKSRMKMFCCYVCNMKYLEKSSLTRHISTKHLDQPVKETCLHCGKSFITKGNLYKHIRTIHQKKINEESQELSGNNAFNSEQNVEDFVEETRISSADEEFYVVRA